MSARLVLTLIVTIMMVMALIPHSAGGAVGMWEEDFRMICNDSGNKRLPKKLTIYQAIDDSFFATAVQTNAVLFASYLFRFDINSGKVIADGVVMKQDGSQVSLPRLKAKMKNGDADKGRSINVVVEPGDVIEWKVKMKGLAPLQGFDCWILEVGVTGTDAVAAMSRLKSMSSLTRSKP